MRGAVVLVLLLGVVLGSCAGAEAHPLDAGGGAERCDVQPVSVKAGAEREQTLDRTAPAPPTSVPDTTIVWHCGTPDTPPPVVAVTALGLRPHAPRAPPRG